VHIRKLDNNWVRKNINPKPNIQKVVINAHRSKITLNVMSWSVFGFLGSLKTVDNEKKHYYDF
jgi:hypothetical protein